MNLTRQINLENVFYFVTKDMDTQTRLIHACILILQIWFVILGFSGFVVSCLFYLTCFF